MTTYYTNIESPLGRLLILGDGDFVTGLYLPDHKGWSGLDPAWERTEVPFREVRKQLDEYFAGKRREFDVPLKPAGTPFQQRVWSELVKIPYGNTLTYIELARRIGQPTASRAVGNANGRNPVSIIVPCHRVVGGNGKLTGYAGGLDKKEWLLNHERA